MLLPTRFHPIHAAKGMNGVKKTGEFSKGMQSYNITTEYVFESDLQVCLFSATMVKVWFLVQRRIPYYCGRWVCPV